MASRTPISALLALSLGAGACRTPGPSSPTAPASPGSETAARGDEPDVAQSYPPGAASTAAAPPGTPAPVPSVDTPPGVAPVSPAERPGAPLPELRVKSFGLHVGGAAKDADLRRAVQRTLERGFSRYLDCYRLIEEPGTEGTFGADLRVAVDGGKPTVEQPRTKLRGDAFRACMIRAFESTRFEPPSSGRAIVVSYSVKFSFGW